MWFLFRILLPFFSDAESIERANNRFLMSKSGCKAVRFKHNAEETGICDSYCIPSTINVHLTGAELRVNQSRRDKLLLAERSRSGLSPI